RANGQAGTSESWTATASTVLSNVTVRAVLTGGGPQSLTVVTFTGTGGVGASAAASAATGAPSVSLTTTRAGSLVYGAGNDWDGGVARTLGANQAMVHQSVVASPGDTFWVQNFVGAVAALGTAVQ